MTNRELLLPVLVLALWVGASIPVMAANTEYDVDRVRWSRLEFRASKLLVTANSEVEISTQPSVEAKEDWLTSEQGKPLMPSGSEVICIKLVVEEWTEIGVDYGESDPTSSRKRRVKERRRAMRIRLHGQPLEDTDSAVDFEFLGLKGDIEIFLDPEGRFPVQISGDIKRAGRGHVRLQRVVLK